nr:reverse transcriptase domain-containing protein [Tanacetum cinerariifolium]
MKEITTRSGVAYEEPSIPTPKKVVERETEAKSSIEEPPESELKDLPSHLEYAYLEGVDKLLVIIAKDLKVDEKEALLKVLKSHKRSITWKITNIKGIDPRFYTHKILMEEDYKPAMQSQRRVNPKIHEVIKKEVIKLLDVGLIYPISDSPWGAVYQNRPQQALNYQAPAQQNTVTHNKFEAYTNANDANMNNLQLKFNNFQKNQQDFQNKFEQKQDDFQNQMMNFMQNLYNNKPSSSSSLPSNTIPIPKGEAKVITTRSGMSYKEPPIPLSGVEQQEPTEVTTDTELLSTEDIEPPLVQVQVQEDKPVKEPSVVIPKAKANLPYPSRLAKEKIRKKDDILAAKFMEIFRDLHFELSFAYALVHIPKFTPMFQKLLNNKNKLIELTKTPLNENCSAVVLKKLPEKLDFVVFDFIVDPRIPLILGRPFLSTAHAIINVHEREIILRQDQQSLTIQCGDIPSIKKVEQINKIDFINPGGIDFDSEEIENFLNDNSIPFGVEDSPFNMDEDILFLESLLREEPSPNHLIIPNQTKSPVEEPKHSFNMGYEHFNTNLVTNDVAKSSTKNLIPIPHEGNVTSENGKYINRMEMLFTINPHPHPSTYANTNVESFSSLPILIQESDSHQEEINVVTITDDVLPQSFENDDSDEEVDAAVDLRVDNFIQNSEHEYSESEDSDFDNPSVPLPPSEPPDEEFDFEIVFGKEISVSEDTIFDPGISD